MKELPINIVALIEREPHELKKFVRNATEWIYNVILSYLGNKEDAEEVTQDCLIAGLDAVKGFKNQSSLKTWMYSIAINKSKDFLKYKTRQKRSAHITSIDGEYGPAHQLRHYDHPGIQLESKEKMNLLFDAINELPENQKTALILSKLDKLRHVEIAVIMSTTPKAVESLLSRAKANLRKYLETQEITFYQKSNVK